MLDRFWRDLQEFLVFSFQKLIKPDVGFLLLTYVESVFPTNMNNFKDLVNRETSLRIISIRKLTDVVVLIFLSWVVSGHLQR